MLDFSTIFILLLLLSIHFVADFVLQSGSMATKKSTSNLWLSYHAAVYTLMFAILTLHPTFALVNGVLHWATDWITSRINARLWTAGRVHEFFVGVGADQLVHFATLSLTAYWILG